MARLTSYVRRKAVGLREWIHMDEKYAVSEFEAQFFGWKKPRRFVVVRELVRDTKEAVVPQTARTEVLQKHGESSDSHVG